MTQAALVLEDGKVFRGAAFGAGGEGSLRLCCVSERSVLEPALQRLEAFLQGG